MGLEKIWNGWAYKLAQENGILTLTFKEGELRKTFFNVDGEFYKGVGIKEIQVKLCEELKD